MFIIKENNFIAEIKCLHLCWEHNKHFITNSTKMG